MTEPADAMATIEYLRAENKRLRKALRDAKEYMDRGHDKMAFNIIRAATQEQQP